MSALERVEDLSAVVQQVRRVPFKWPRSLDDVAAAQNRYFGCSDQQRPEMSFRNLCFLCNLSRLRPSTWSGDGTLPELPFILVVEDEELLQMNRPGIAGGYFV
jgi:hypothetical protein